MRSAKTIRIGNGAGFWGDQLDAPRLLAESGNLDYLTLEYLAELTLSILAHQRQRDENLGYVTDLVAVVRSLVPQMKVQPSLKIITNAGGINPSACARAVANILTESQLANVKIATVTGDDLLSRLDDLVNAGELFVHFDNNQTMNDIRQRASSANVYLGAEGIATALSSGAQIVITGRVADAALAVGPAVFEFDWRWDDWDLLAAATTAGHLIECGAQVTGGIFSGWSSDTDYRFDRIGYPIVELSADGDCVITKPIDSDGRVDEATVSEQLVYEIGDPGAYVTPDVIADFSQVQLELVGTDRVRIVNCRGRERPPEYKMSMSFADGFVGVCEIVVAGPNTRARAAACEAAVRSRLQRIEGLPKQIQFEYLGTGAVVPGVVEGQLDPPEIVLRAAARDLSRGVVDRFLRELTPLVTSGPPGVTGYTGVRPKTVPVHSYWPTKIRRDHVKTKSTVLEAGEWCNE